MQLANQPGSHSARSKQQQLACRSGNKPARSHAFAESNTISSELAPHAHRPLESGPRTAPLTQRVGSHPSHERCSMVSHGVTRRMHAQHQTEMTVHVRKLNRATLRLMGHLGNSAANSGLTITMAKSACQWSMHDSPPLTPRSAAITPLRPTNAAEHLPEVRSYFHLALQSQGITCRICAD
jgi:hypothetical protein